MALKPEYAKVQLNGESGNENISNDGPKRSNGNDRAITREGEVESPLPTCLRIRIKLVQGTRIRHARPKGNLTQDTTPRYRRR